MNCYIKCVLLLLATNVVTSVCGQETVNLTQEWKERFIYQINVMRAKYCAPPLTWAVDVAQSAEFVGLINSAFQATGSLFSNKPASYHVEDYQTVVAHAAHSGLPSITPEECALAGHRQISAYFNRGNATGGWGQFESAARWDVTLVGAVLLDSGDSEQLCVVNFDRRFGDSQDSSKPTVFPTTCRLLQKSCDVDPDKREDFSWGQYNEWTKDDCDKMGCCYDDTVPGIPKIYYPLEGDKTGGRACAVPGSWKNYWNKMFSDNNGPSYKPGTTVKFQCGDDTDFADEMRLTSTCLHDGNWSAIYGNCNSPKTTGNIADMKDTNKQND